MDDIWDDDTVEIARPAPGPSRSRALLSDSDSDHAVSNTRPSKRARTDKPLFNPDSDDEDNISSGAGNKDNLPPEIDALFDGLDDDDFVTSLPAQLDTVQLQREADQLARVEAAKKRLARGEQDVLGELADDGGGKPATGEKPSKPKRVIPKLDESRLLDRDGLPALVQQIKSFNIKGKGHELSDLNRLMQMYQLWAHKMFPKMQFHDTIERVERLCRTKRMHVALSTWRDMQNPPVPEDAELDAEADANGEADGDQAATQDPPTSSPARITLEPGGPPVRQSQARSESGDDEEEIWREMMDAMQSQNQAKQKQATAIPDKGQEGRFDEYEEEDWAIMDEIEQRLDLSGDVDQTASTKPVQQAESSGASSSPGPEHDVSSDAPPDPIGTSEDEDDFYAMYEP